MTSVLRASLFKMTFVLSLLALMGAWQADFIITGITANIFLNSCIFGTFFVGIYAAYMRVIGLRNDIVAFQSLREDYDDAVNANAAEGEASDWRLQRCKEPAQVFVTPRILERPYTILSEEIAENRELAVSTSAMQNLLDNVDEQLDEGRSLIAYVTGLLVFLGLIGTFIGLMVTLGSVGDIIGGLDLSGGAGAEAIQKLMDDLQIPLKGMATGFSSSLFGLITSLALGLVALFANQAAGKLKGEFGTWLASVAKVGSEKKHGGQGDGSFASQAIENARVLSLMYRSAKMSLVSNARVVATVESMAEASRAILAAQGENQSDLKTLAGTIQALAIQTDITNKTLLEMAGLIEDREALREAIARLRASGEAHAERLEKVASTFDELVKRHTLLQNQTRSLAKELANRDDLNHLSSDVKRHLEREIGGVFGALVEVSDTLSEVQTAFGARSDKLRVDAQLLTSLSEDLRSELDHAIIATRETLDEARARWLEELEQSSELERKIEATNAEKRHFLKRWRKRA